MITDPRFAPSRSDLPFLRRRVRPKVQAEPAPAKQAAPATRPTPPRVGARPDPAATIDYTRRDREPEPAPPPVRPAAQAAPPRPVATPPVRPATPAPPVSTGTVDYTHRGSSGSLDLDDTPAPVAPVAPGAPTAGGGSLDLSDAPPPTRRAPAVPEPLPAWQQRHVVRVVGNNQQLMSVADPTVTLSRVQSGIGQLTVEAFCSPEIGDLRLGAAYTLRSGGSGIVAHADGNRFGPSSRRPVIVGSREEYERLGIDLRQTPDIERIAVYAYSESRTELTWGGTLVVTLLRGARLEIPLEKLYVGKIAMLLTFCNMDGELVARAEMETIVGDVREAARAYGFDRITWRDDRSPVD